MRESVCWRGWADENRNVKKLSYATPRTGLRAKPKAWKLSKSPMGEQGGSARRRGWVCVSACSGMPSRSLRVRKKIRAGVEKDDLASIIPNHLSNNLLCCITEWYNTTPPIASSCMFNFICWEPHLSGRCPGIPVHIGWCLLQKLAFCQKNIDE